MIVLLENNRRILRIWVVIYIDLQFTQFWLSDMSVGCKCVRLFLVIHVIHVCFCQLVISFFSHHNVIFEHVLKAERLWDVSSSYRLFIDHCVTKRLLIQNKSFENNCFCEEHLQVSGEIKITYVIFPFSFLKLNWYITDNAELHSHRLINWLGINKLF